MLRYTIAIATSRGALVPVHRGMEWGVHAVVRRLLALKLVNGKLACKALEFRPMPEVDPEVLAPGSKVCIANASVKAGVVLLDSKSLKVRCTSFRAALNRTSCTHHYGRQHQECPPSCLIQPTEDGDSFQPSHS
jgi:hypothetical protein